MITQLIKKKKTQFQWADLNPHVLQVKKIYKLRLKMSRIAQERRGMRGDGEKEAEADDDKKEGGRGGGWTKGKKTGLEVYMLNSV